MIPFFRILQSQHDMYDVKATTAYMIYGVQYVIVYRYDTDTVIPEIHNNIIHSIPVSPLAPVLSIILDEYSTV
jgi:hypothetical protein